ncbi:MULTISPECIES: DUF4998 domain-containing protein [Pedobacter]|uniref:DUF4998 domain-containing protein n=1 Tax=Pedobacter TaxID=84567 RepID=UPI00292DB268|nr:MULTISPECIES: DUF4998 domain-containing protein [Pedobacter]
MNAKLKNILSLWLLTAIFGAGCSDKDQKYKELLGDGEIVYPGVIAKPDFRAGNLRTQLVWNPSPDPNIQRYVIYWNNNLDSLVVPATRLASTDTVKVIVPNLREGTYSFTVYSHDKNGHVSIPININGVRVFGPIYQSGIFNRGYNADTPYVVNLANGSVQLKFNRPDSINLGTTISYTENTGAVKSVVLSPDSNQITLKDFGFGTSITYQSSYIPLRGGIDIFTVSAPSTYPEVRRIGDVTSFYIKNPGAPFLRSDNGTGKWGLPKDWQYNANAVNQNNDTGGGWSTDGGGVIHLESKNWGDAGLDNAKVYQSVTLPPGSYAFDCLTQGYGGTFNVNIVVAQGTVMPDITNLGGVLARFQGNNGNLGGTHTLNFTLTQSTTVVLGWVASSDVFTYIQFKSVKLRSL